MDLGNYGIGGNEVKIDASEGIAEIPQNRTATQYGRLSEATRRRTGPGPEDIDGCHPGIP